MRQNPHVFPILDQAHNPLRLPRETTSEPPKVARACGFLYILTSTCASRHNSVHFFDISTSKSGPRWCVLYILTWKCASRHNGVQFFISHLASWLRTRRFSEPTFRPSETTNHWKTQCFLLCFSSVHLVGNLTSKLPSINKSTHMQIDI